MPLFHAGHERGGDEEYAVEVDPHERPPIGVGHRVERLLGKDAGTVDEDVATAEALVDFRGKHGDRLGRGHVAFDRERPAARRFDHAHRLIRGSEVRDGDVDALRGEPPGERLADAVGPARDERDFALMSLGHWIPGE